MTDRDMIRAAMEAAGVQTGPRARSYVHPRFNEPAEEPTEQVEDEEQPQATPAKTTSTRPIPTGEPQKRLTPTGGHDPYRLPEPDPRAEARETADRVLRRLNGQDPSPTLGDQRGTRI